MNKIKQIFIQPSSKYANSNIYLHYEIQNASWLWHPECLERDISCVVLFECEFNLTEKSKIKIHVSADNRYELSLDEKLISRGPHRCDEYHWSFSSYELELEKGNHKFSAVCNWLFEEAPMAQHTVGHGGFILAADEPFSDILNTGKGNWKTAKWEGWSYEPNPLRRSNYCAVGHQFVMNGNQLFSQKKWAQPQVIIPPIKDSHTGLIQIKWKLYPTSLPELMHEPRSIGKLRGMVSKENLIAEIASKKSEVANWDGLINQNQPIRINENSSKKWIIDLENYYCGFPQIKINGGKGSILKIAWAESLYQEGDRIKTKGNRNEINNKYFYGFGDTILPHGDTAVYKPLWWRCGRYLLIEIETKEQSLSIDEFKIIETRYPYEFEGSFSSSNPLLESLIPLMVRGLQSCSHESFMDCPYYEQLMYVGDTRIEMLINHVMSTDDRLTKRCIEIFDWSRYSTGYVMERYPSSQQQLSLTFSLIWPLILKDYALWRNDRNWVQQRLIGARNMLENMRIHCNSQGLLEGLPGWSFIDWVPGWHHGTHPDLYNAPSSIINLFFVLALNSTADLEEEYGNKHLAQRNREEALIVSKSIKEVFWNSSRSLFSDNPAMTSFSEHAQSLALIANILEGQDKEKCIESLLSSTDLCRATVYFSHYLFEAYAKIGKSYLIEEKLLFWKNMLDNGLRTPVEQPEPTRSDCHAWGAHPLYHYYASIAGIQPSSFGFKNVSIKPQPGSLSFIDCTLPHPEGQIKLNLKFTNQNANGTIELPNNAQGTFTFGEKNIDLKNGINKI